MPAEAKRPGLEAMKRALTLGTMLWEGEPLPSIKALLNAMGNVSVVYAPVVNRPSSGNILSVMRSNIERLEPELLETRWNSTSTKLDIFHESLKL